MDELDDWFEHDRQQAASFYSDDVIEVGELDANEVAVPLSRLCGNLGLDLLEQLDALEHNQLLQAAITTMAVDTPRGVQRQPCLRVDLVPLWLLGLRPTEVAEEVRPKLELFQRECASVLWQAFRPQGFPTHDTLLPERQSMAQSDQGYITMMAMACLSRQQLMLERQIDAERAEQAQRGTAREQVIDPQARQMAQAVRVVAHSLAMRTRRNEYPGVYQGLYRQFGISSYRHIPRSRFMEAMEWLDRWRGDIEGEPEPPPDI